MRYTELDTPALLVNLERMEANISRMADLARRQGVSLRPHTKTHKCPDLAKMQLANGANGITCAKLGEAEVMAAAGFDDILIANEIIGEQKYVRLLKLAEKIKCCIAIDSEFGAATLNQALEQAHQTLDIVIEINCGQNRSGVPPGEAALKLARQVSGFKQLQLKGIMTHGGHAYHESTREGVEKIGLHEGTVMVETAELLRKNGIAVEIVSVGSTPTAEYCSRVDGVTEIRPGTYIFYDLTQIDLFSCALKDCALSVLATVTSRPAANRTILDAGKKVLTSDPAGRSGKNKGFGLLPKNNCIISRLSEEHGIIDSECEFSIGEKVKIIPNHVCVVVNMFDKMYGIRNGDVEKEFHIDGRGKVL